MPYIYFFSILVGIIIIITVVFLIIKSYLQQVERRILHTFLLKVSKIPVYIEVMRDFVADQSAFKSITALHSEANISEFDSIYSLLELNVRIHREFSFLMKLSVQIPDIQEDPQFLYVRDFIVQYEQKIKEDFDVYNHYVRIWNILVILKNITIIGFIFPGKRREFI